jgi:hypothetical protein
MLLALFSNLLLLIPPRAASQNEVTEADETFKARNLSGQVQLGDSSEGVKGVLVEDCTPHWKAVKASTHTDNMGRFNFPHASRARVHYLRLSFRGAHTLLIRVKLESTAPQELLLKLSFAT